MEIGNNDTDNMLQDIGIVTPNTAQSSGGSNDYSAFSDDDISSILEENGFSQLSEDNIDDNEEEDDFYDDNQGEGRDVDIETLDEEESHEDEESTSEETTSDVDESQKIPLNSPTLLIDESTSRFSGAEWFNEIKRKRIIIAGQGGIGSNLTFQIARMTPANITLYDDDTVEMVNMAGQLYSKSDVGKAKVDAIAGMVQNYTTMGQINAIKEKFTSTTEPGNIMMCGFDNMNARKTFFNSWANHVLNKPEDRRKECLFLDGRLSMTTLQILCIRGDDWHDIDRYRREFLFRDSEAEEIVCSLKQTTYLACMIGSLMTNLFTNFVANSLDPIISYDLPFFTEYDAQTMIFKTEN